ncbi:MAG: hypothetical protein ACPGYT_11210, partial [Nitrospirales bacterium]
TFELGILIECVGCLRLEVEGWLPLKILIVSSYSTAIRKLTVIVLDKPERSMLPPVNDADSRRTG